MAQEDRYVLHTSVLVKWFRPGEVLAARALALRDAYLAGQIAVTVPTPAAYELANVLRYKADLTTDPVGAGWDWVAPSPVAMGQAIDIARTYDVTVAQEDSHTQFGVIVAQRSELLARRAWLMGR
jgi:predicted nucleic acid-binding protein